MTGKKVQKNELQKCLHRYFSKTQVFTDTEAQMDINGS